jgi:dipeptidyl aminopeptidase/acylaminoacyl peptidase
LNTNSFPQRPRVNRIRQDIPQAGQRRKPGPHAQRLGALLDWIQQNPSLDAGKIMITGGSYGGYMTWAIAYEYNDKICCTFPSLARPTW